MNFWILLSVSFAVAHCSSYESLETSDEYDRRDSSSNEYERPDFPYSQQDMYRPRQGYPQILPSPDYPRLPSAPYGGPSGPHYPQYDNSPKLKTLRGDKIVKAKLRYYTSGPNTYVVISCPRNSTPGAYTWILADSKRGRTPSFGHPETVTLAGGIHVEYIAKLVADQKWEGRDFTDDEKHKFRRVGCTHGQTQSFVQN
ncbi:hypothetical protein L5515_018628 [Caenorhabditis briggsae]|uniref:Secreted protein n=1 Tax=Caenorhabditis briggsae TaxID=6238 RepID=A0AAE9JS56_CAEBR|nr:hypothetical protein L5515_018628 [Caenorhabditis briggsae]